MINHTSANEAENDVFRTAMLITVRYTFITILHIMIPHYGP